MLKLFLPDDYYISIYNIDFEKLYKEGYKGIIFDIDNTLVPYDVKYPTKENKELFNSLKDIGFKICLLSNNNKERVYTYSQDVTINAIPKGLKPLKRNINKAIGLLKTNKEETVIVGDQIFTDVLGGNRVGIKTILVKPISEKEEWISSIKRSSESFIIKKYERNRANE